MRFQKLTSIGCAMLLCVAAAAQTAPVQTTKDKTAIEQVLHDQEAAWNRGDIDSFMRGYKDSPETTFIGKTHQPRVSADPGALQDRLRHRERRWAPWTSRSWQCACWEKIMPW